MIRSTGTLRKKQRGRARRVLAGFIVTCALLLTATVNSRQAYAICVCAGCTCTADEFVDNMIENITLHMETRFDVFGTVIPLPYFAYDTNPGFIEFMPQGTSRLGEHQEFFWNVWYENFLPVWMFMSQQLTQNMMWHTFTIGTYIDAKHQLETQALFQERTAEIHKRYQPSHGVCWFGTNIRSLAASERHSKLVRHTLNRRLMNRQLGTEGGPAIMGPSSDQASRVKYFLDHVCDRFDNNRIYNNPNTGFANICEDTPRTDGTVNNDVDFTRLIMNPRTLNVDFADEPAAAVNQSGAVFNLAANLYGHKVPTNVDVSSEKQISLQSKMLDMRSVIAKRSMAQTSYSAIVGLKARGSEGSGETNTLQYMTLLLQELGLDENEVKAFIGERPSYYAQLEVLAKKIYQNPDFYRELYDKPENTKRKSVAMGAISSMLDREIFDSQLRAEAMYSQLLELKVLKAQDAVEDSFSGKGTE